MGTPRISEFGIWEALRVIRTKDGQSLAELSRTSGVSLGYLSDLEGGHRWPNATQLKKIAAALNVPISVIERHGQDRHALHGILFAGYRTYRSKHTERHTEACDRDPLR
ncbi:hypothetical protein A5742_07860 [Mycolicibacterium fortuitum]|uniref:HTH cro/C1-type domain-containing protein n=1 Tax=Mycolicibacterium fortuitum TaxID=1766 RepID=A0ABD6QG35_MYCFO|nr:helix-turn-helix transcriptional regulator [Mycolicibacterium fortuitum]OMC37988.1 hypothetical protein A5742_07860 [Mycolicibacterium fortuitum]